MRRLALALLGLAWGAGCFKATPAPGPYRCDVAADCASGWTCDDGLCCELGGTPGCPTLPVSSGHCADGGSPGTYYPDCDQDGWGDPTQPVALCAQPVLLRATKDGGLCAFVRDGGDCNDDPRLGGQLVYPAAPEICDGVDNNCNGQIDEGLPRKPFFKDRDSDGWGDADAGLTACQAPPGYIDTAGDCNDLNPAVHPGAAELCNGIDDNCNGVVDENPLFAGDPCADTTRAGPCAEGRQVCVDGGFICPQFVFPKPEVCDGVDNDCDGVIDNPPGCGGARDLLATGDAGRGLVRNAEDVGFPNAFTDTANYGCLKGYPGSSHDSVLFPAWLGAGPDSHIFWFESLDGWDLTRDGGVKLHLSFDYRITEASWPPCWSPDEVTVRFCSKNGYRTYTIPNVLFQLAAGSPYQQCEVDNVLGLDLDLGAQGGGPGWSEHDGGLDLSAVKRVEVMLQPVPYQPGGATVGFRVTWLDGGFY